MAYVRDSSEDLVWDSGSGQYVPAGPVSCTLTVTPSPADATVTLEATDYTTVTGTGSQSITVDSGTSVTYSVYKTGYEPEANTITVSSTNTITITLTQLLNFTIVPTPADATVELDTPNYEQEGNTIYVSSGTSVDWSVSAPSYIPQSGTQVVTANLNMPVALVELYTLTIAPTPSDATVTLTAAGYTQQGNSIEVPAGTSVSYSVSKTGYITSSNTITVNSTDTLPISLTIEQHTLTITPNPIDANVELTASGYTPVSGTGSQSITVDYGTVVNYVVTKTGYTTITNAETVNADNTLTVNMSVAQYTITVNPTPADATVTLSAVGFSQVGNAITVNYGTQVDWSVAKQGFTTQSGTIASVTADQYLNIDLSSNLVTLMITPDPADANVTLTAPGYTQSGNYISVDIGTAVSWQVTKTGYETKSGSVASLTSNQNINVALRELVTVTVIPSPADATVVLTSAETGYTQVGNAITVPSNVAVSYSVSRTDYITKTGTITPDVSQTLNVSLLVARCTLTIVPTPNDATVVLTATGETQSGNTITVDNGTSVAYTVSKTGYVTQTSSLNVTYNRTLNIDLVNLVTLTVNPIPVNASVVLTSQVSGYSQVGNAITVPNGTSVDYVVSAQDYITKMGTRVVTTTHTETIALTSSSTTMDDLNVVPDVNPSTEYGDHAVKTDVVELLKDKVDSYQGTTHSGKVLAVDTDGYVKLSQGLPGFVANWGEINGTLSDQIDLQNALNLKANDSVVVKISGNQEINGTKKFNSTIWLKLTDTDHTIAPSAFKERIYGIEDMNNKRIGSFGTSIAQNTTTVRCYMGASKEISGSYQYSLLETYIDDAGNKWATAPVPAASNSTSETKIATVGWVNNPSSSTNVVHRTGTETISGAKIFTSTITGTCTNALWADLAEQYESDEKYEIGTLIKFGGEKDITIANDEVNGVISKKPGFLLDAHLEDSLPVALVGKTPVRIIGKVNKFDKIALSEIPGVGRVAKEGERVIARALESSDNEEEKLVNCVTKFTL